MKILSIDAGFGKVKAMCGDRMVEFPSAVCEVSLDFPIDGIFEDDHEDILQYAGKKYIVGEYATGRKNVLMTKVGGLSYLEYLPLYLKTAVKMIGLGGEKPDVVVTGVPILYAGEKNAAQDTLKKSVEYVYGSDSYEIDCEVMIQGVGAVYDHRLDMSGNVIRNVKESIVTVDVGYNTIDVAVTDSNGQFIKDECYSFTDHGATQVIEKMLPYLQKNGVSFNAYEVQDLLINKSVKIFGKEVSISEITRDILSDYAKWIWNILNAKYYERLARTDRVILCGGFASVLKDYIPDKYKDFVVIPENPGFANARGWLKAVTFISQSNLS